MRYHWLRDRSTQSQLQVYWDHGSNNYADYFTKHHAPLYHRLMRPKYIQMANLLRLVTSSCSIPFTPASLRGCVHTFPSQVGIQTC